MAQVIAVLCDVHLSEDGQQVPGQSYRFGVQLPDERWEWTDVDLCPSHATDPVGGLVQLLAKYGRTFAPDASVVGRRPPGRPPKPRAATAPTDGPPANVCPVCGRAYASHRGLGQHQTRSGHGPT